MIPNLVPKEISIIPEKVFDKFWIEEIVISSPILNGEANARVRLKKFGVFDGVPEFMPGDSIWINIDNLLTRSSTDPELANVVQSLMLYIKKVGIEQNIME